MALDRTWYNTLVDDDGSGLTGSVWDKADVDALMDAVDAELAPVHCAVSRSVGGGQSISNNVTTVLSWDVIHEQTVAGMAVAGSSNISIPKSGFYLVEGVITWAANTTGIRDLFFYLNGAPIASGPGAQEIMVPASPTLYTIIQKHAVMRLQGGHSVQLAAYQNSGGALVCGGISGSLTNHLRVTRLSALT